MDAQAILSIDLSNSRSLFPGDRSAIGQKFRKLVQDWHPDHNSAPDARDVYEHLVALRGRALAMVDGGRTASGVARGTVRDYELVDGGRSRFTYLRRHTGDLGDILVGRQTLAYEIPNDYADVAEAEKVKVSNLIFADDRMKSEMRRYLPTLKRSIEVLGKTVHFYERPADTILLADLKLFLGASVPPVHVAWIVSSLMNMVCYLNWSKLVHGAISQETVLVCPAKHSIMLVGGWGYATKTGDRPLALPRRTTSLVPRILIKTETVTSAMDIDLIKEIAQDLLGQSGGVGLHLDAAIPRPLIDWTLSPSSDDATREYRIWQETIKASFGKRSFVKLDVDPSAVYAS